MRVQIGMRASEWTCYSTTLHRLTQHPIGLIMCVRISDDKEAIGLLADR